MKTRVAIHGWFQNKAGWAFHPGIAPEVRRRLIAALGHETTIGAVGPIDPRPLPGHPSLYIVGTRTEGQVAAEGERRKPILRLALLPGRPTSVAEVEAFLGRLDAITPAGPGNDDALQLEWDGELVPLAPAPEVRSEPTPGGRPRPVAIAAAFVALAALLLVAWLGWDWRATPGGKTGGEPAPEGTNEGVATVAPTTASGSPATKNDWHNDFQSRAATARTIRDAIALRDEYLAKKSGPNLSKPDRTALAAVGDAFWRAYFTLEPDFEPASEKSDGAEIYASISAQFAGLYRANINPFFDKLPEYRDYDETRTKLSNDPRWAKLRGSYEFFLRLIRLRHYPEASSLLQAVRSNVPGDDFKRLDDVIADVEVVAQQARQGTTIEVRDLEDRTLSERSQVHFGNGPRRTRITLDVKLDATGDGQESSSVEGSWQGDRLVFRVPYEPRPARAVRNPKVRFQVVSTHLRDLVRLASNWTELVDEEESDYLASGEVPSISVLLVVGRPRLKPPVVPSYSELFPKAPNSELAHKGGSDARRPPDQDGTPVESDRPGPADSPGTSPDRARAGPRIDQSR